MKASQYFSMTNFVCKIFILIVPIMRLISMITLFGQSINGEIFEDKNRNSDTEVIWSLNQW